MSSRFEAFGARKVLPRSAVALAVGLTAGCDAGTSAHREPDLPLESVIERADAEGAGEHQLQVLREASSDGKLTFEQLSALNALTVECLSDAGLEAFVTDPIEATPGVALPQFGARGIGDTSQATVLGLINECGAKYSFYAQEYYLAQPASVDAQDEAFDEMRPEIERCLNEHGIAVGQGLLNSELFKLIERDFDANSQLPGFEPCWRGGEPSSPG